MPGSLIAKRYAKALFDFSLEMNHLERTKTDMELIISVCESNADFKQLLRSPVIRTEKKQKILKAIFGKELSDMSMRYLDIITRKNRESFIKQIAEEYIFAYKKFKNIFTIYFESATAITADIRKKVIELLEEQTKGSVELIEDVKKELVGGFVLNYDDYRYDASIAYQLKKLKKESAEINLYVREL